MRERNSANFATIRIKFLSALLRTVEGALLRTIKAFNSALLRTVGLDNSLQLYMPISALLRTPYIYTMGYVLFWHSRKEY